MTENVEKIQELIHEDHHQTIHELAYTTGISYGVCQISTFEHVMHGSFIKTMLPPTHP
jgi:hypothetical protein